MSTALEVLRTLASVALMGVATYHLVRLARIRTKRRILEPELLLARDVLQAHHDYLVARHLHLTPQQVDELPVAEYDAVLEAVAVTWRRNRNH